MSVSEGGRGKQSEGEKWTKKVKEKERRERKRQARGGGADQGTLACIVEGGLSVRRCGWVCVCWHNEIGILHFI